MSLIIYMKKSLIERISISKFPYFISNCSYMGPKLLGSSKGQNSRIQTAFGRSKFGLVFNKWLLFLA